MADSSAFLALSRSPPNTLASPSYRSPPAAASANARSPASAASTRGSSWAASATTSTQPGSATTARRSTRGICSAPPPRDAQRPDTTPPTTYSGRNLPPETQASSQAQPCAACSRDSSLYSSSGGMAGWSISRSTENLVDGTRTPPRPAPGSAGRASPGSPAGRRGPPRSAPASSASRGRARPGQGRRQGAGRAFRPAARRARRPARASRRRSSRRPRARRPTRRPPARRTSPDARRPRSAATGRRARPISASSAHPRVGRPGPRRLEQRALLLPRPLPRPARRARPPGALGRRRCPAQPRVGRRQRGRLLAAALPAEQQPLGERHVVAARRSAPPPAAARDSAPRRWATPTGRLFLNARTWRRPQEDQQP